MENLTSLTNIEYLIKKFCVDSIHANQVANLAILLFDKTNIIAHNLPEKQRERLKIASILHDIGHFYGDEKHNQASFNIIIENGIEGVSPKDIAIIANITRYHRGKLPDKTHINFINLPNDQERKNVEALSAFLRIADGLDKDHKCLVKDLDCEFDKKNNVLFIDVIPVNKDFLLDMNVLLKKKVLFEKVFATQVVFRLKFGGNTI
ncbi:MAG: HD domain-containing protein [Candidatus Gastranaerophilaceae bacterium]|jgi:exopolyphosphatase/guanosine-5'-triphosphate,3'-diphosphate pyrophosphatase